MKTFKFYLIGFGLICMLGCITSCENNDTAGEKIEEAGEDLADAFRSDKEEVQADLREARKKVDNKLAALRADLAEASEDSKDEINKQINQLEKWGNNLDKDMERVGDGIMDGWEKLKGNVRESLDEMENEWDDVFDS